MGKKKEKKKKKKRHNSDDSPERKSKYDDEYYDEQRNKRSKYDKESSSYSKDQPRIEEYVYDYSGQEMVQGAKDVSQSPDVQNDSRYYRDKDRRQSPTPPPPGEDWPYEKEESSWKQKDDVRRDQEYQDEVDRKYRDKQKETRKKREASPIPASTNDDSSMSIEETNKLRIKLGLKPLDLNDGSASSKTEKSYADREDVHKPAANIAEKKHSDKMRDKMEAIREKRKINNKLKKIKGLGEEDDPALDSAAAWVARSRVMEKEKELADKRAQMLEEMDEEFGISGLIEQTVGTIKKEPGYSSKDLRGLTVQHKGTAFQEGSEVVLTLEDKGVLAEDDEDVLINVNIKDDEKAKKNVENRTKKPGYKAYDEVDDETGMLKVRGILDKYDDEIDGEKKSQFRLDGSGKADGNDELERIRETLKSHQVSLEMAAPSLARDYYTEEEMVKFKKPRKKVRKVRKREVLKADDLLKLDVDSIKDRGSRKKGILKNGNKSTAKGGEEDMEIVPTLPDEVDYFVAVRQHEEPEPLVDDDEAEQELQIALQRSRRTKVKKEVHTGDEEVRVEKMARDLLNKPVKEETPPEQQQQTRSKKKGKGTIILDSTSEFCRTLGELPTVGSSRSSRVVEEKDEEMEVEPVPENKGGWELVEMTESQNTITDMNEEDDDDVLEPEPIPNGLVATLNLANMKGYLKNGKEKVRKFDPLNLPETKASVDIEKLRDEEKGRYSRGYESRERYDPYAFKEKTHYKPEVKLEYVDNKGRELNQKEAFRLLSHKFHGKGSGKLKTEKRAKKIQEEKKLQLMNSIDTPLNTASMFKEKQKASQSAYLVLSGGGKNLLSGNTLKK